MTRPKKRTDVGGAEKRPDLPDFKANFLGNWGGNNSDTVISGCGFGAS